MKITYKVKGDKKTLKNLNRYKHLSTTYIKENLKKSAETLNETAMENLNKKLGTGYTGKKWGHSDQQSIKDSAEISEAAYGEGKIEVTLTYRSPHAAVVEFGAIAGYPKPVHASQYGYKAWPIGKSQGGSPQFAKYFRVQPGYHYLDNASKSFRFLYSPNEGFRGLMSKALLKAGHIVGR